MMWMLSTMGAVRSQPAINHTKWDDSEWSEGEDREEQVSKLKR